MSDNKSNEVNDESLDYLSSDALHENYLKILKFAYPDEAIKEWVKNDPERHGKYHLDVEWIFPIVQKIEMLSSEGILIDFIISNGMVEVQMYESQSQIGNFIFQYKDLYANTEYDKTFAIYRAVIHFIDFFNKEIHNELFKSGSYLSPYQRLQKELKHKRMQFSNATAVNNLAKTAAQIFGVTLEDIYSKSRKRDVVKARQLCMAILYNDGRSLDASAGIFGKDHATVLHGNKAIMDIIDVEDKDYYKLVMEVLEAFNLVGRFNPVTRKEK